MPKKKKGGKEREKSLNIGLESLTDRDGQKGTKHLFRARNKRSVPAGALCHRAILFAQTRTRQSIDFSLFPLSPLSSLLYEPYFCNSLFPFFSSPIFNLLESSNQIVRSRLVIFQLPFVWRSKHRDYRCNDTNTPPPPSPPQPGRKTGISEPSFSSGTKHMRTAEKRQSGIKPLLCAT